MPPVPRSARAGPLHEGRDRKGTTVAVAGNLGYATGPVVVFAVLALLALFMRWAFGNGGGTTRRPPAPADDGLLLRVATTSSRESALALRAVLSDAGIRSTDPLPRAAPRRGAGLPRGRRPGPGPGRHLPRDVISPAW